MTHNISPILLELGPFTIFYYGLFFAIGIVLYILIARWIFKRENLKVEDFYSLGFLLLIGLIVGARLGFVFFYNAGHYMDNPIDILKIWEGGLASHGATLGLLIVFVLYYLYKRKKEPGFKFSKYADLLVIPMPLVAAFVRMGNFFNSEIVGRQTDLPWGIIFANNGDTIARHPVQLYELLINLAIFALLLIIYFKAYKKIKPFFMMFLFIGVYFLTRFLIEFTKEYQVVESAGGWNMGMTMGQILSIIPVLIAIAFFIFIYPKIKNKTTDNSNNK